MICKDCVCNQSFPHKSKGDVIYINEGVCINVYSEYYGAPVEMLNLDFCPHLLTEDEFERRQKVHKKLRDKYLKNKKNKNKLTYFGKETKEERGE